MLSAESVRQLMADQLISSGRVNCTEVNGVPEQYAKRRPNTHDQLTAGKTEITITRIRSKARQNKSYNNIYWSYRH